ncbi:sigma-70 family RNA polymerase sigma factor [Sinorhizobium sp. RAC02]|uniref:RNA polymerase sigma factor n=1 Tax=Sinorhizobium sp. RAC02 TaxID=1842534 RepID=UPI00256FD76A|nr:sigma-70 family RNA polymerase sigma factor [Sinorhizobium sp. RAC02]
MDSYNELVRHLTVKLRSRSDANDVAQETFLKISRMGGDTVVDNPRSYLFRMADNAAIDHLRRQKVRTRLASDEPAIEQPADTPSPEEQVDYRQRLVLLTRIVDDLPPRQKQAFVLHKFDGLGHQEIAAKLGISRSAVEKLLMKALATCRDRFGEHLE